MFQNCDVTDSHPFSGAMVSLPFFLFEAFPNFVQPLSLSLCIRPSTPTSFQFYRVLDLLLVPEGLLSNSSVPPVSLPRLSPLWLLSFFFVTFSSCSSLRHHPGALIYKLPVPAQPTPHPHFSPLLLHNSAEIAAVRRRGRKAKEGAIGEDMICQPKEDDKEFECQRAVGTDFPTCAASKEEVDLSLSLRDRERPGGEQIRSK